MTSLGGNQQLVIQIVQELSNDDFKVLSPALRAVGNFMSAENNKIAENFLFHGVLDKFDSLLMNNNVNIIKETLWSLSNLAAGSSENISRLFSNDRIISRLAVLINSPSIDIKKEAIWVITNSLTCCDSHTYWEILDSSKDFIIDGLINALHLTDEKLIGNVLETFERILEFHLEIDTQGYQNMCDILENKDILSRLERIQTLPNTKNYQMADKTVV
jgi:hypothetical protein